jgi:hypothetical protein
MSSSSDAPDPTVRAPQLNGWKEIAAYLGRSVRTVQRWEKEFGLPVRRFGISKPESVFAIRSEIDAWLLTSQAASARRMTGAGEVSAIPDEPPKPLVGGPGRDGQPLVLRGRLTRLLFAALAVVALAAVAWAAWVSLQLVRDRGQQTAPPAPAAAPANWSVDHDTLAVSDAGGRVLWSHKFPRELNATSYAGSSWTPRYVVGGITDLEGDGTREVWLVTKSLGAPFWTALYLFEADGRVRWAYQPELTVRFGANMFGPSWIVDRAFITADPAGGQAKAVWAVLYDTALFPSAIQRLDVKTGKPQSAYWSNGSITAAVLDSSLDPPRLFVGACYNETKAGSLSVLDARDPNGSAPAALEKYRCTSCPPGDPLAFLVFPKPARFRGQDATGPVDDIRPMPDGRLRILVRYATVDERRAAVGVLTLDSSLTPVSADTADDYLNTYNDLVRRGHVPAGAPEAVDPDGEFFPILRWDAAAKRYIEVLRRR